MNNSLKILFYGAKGWIGSSFLDFLQSKGHVCIVSSYRVDSNEALNEILFSDADWVVCTIGRTHGVVNDKVYSTIDYLEQPGKLVDNIRDNLYAPLSLAEYCERSNIKLFYLGTGCIFSYDDKDTPGQHHFTEADNPNFFGSSYSIVKGFTDRLMRKKNSTVLNARIRMPISKDDNPRDFITKIVSYAKNAKICNMPNSMTVLHDFYPIWEIMMMNGTTGTFNFTNPGYTDHVSILKLYKQIIDPTLEWSEMTLKEQDLLLLSKRSNNVLDTSKIKKYNVPDIHKSILDVIYNRKSTFSVKTPIVSSESDCSGDFKEPLV